MEFYDPSKELDPPPHDELPPGLRIVCISDTHSVHEKILHIPEADAIIHAGDFSSTGKLKDLRAFSSWFSSLPHRHKIFIAGNHDITLHKEYYVTKGARRFHYKPEMREGMTPEAYSDSCREVITTAKDCIYLEDSSADLGTPENPIHVYGSPWQPEFCDWAFNLDRGAPCREKWSQILPTTDVLITHGPPYGFGDKTVDDFNCGCVDLLEVIKSRDKQPRVHIFGHIHEGYGHWNDGKTLYINASTCNYNYRPLNKPILFHLPFEASLPATILDY